MKSEKRGFTLIELLVVIAIIGLLASIVLASLNSARRKSRDARRIADLKQLQNALELFANDNGGVYPVGATAATCNAAGGCTMALLLGTGAGQLGTAYMPASSLVDPLNSGQQVYLYRTSATASPTGYCVSVGLEGALPAGTLSTCSSVAISTSHTTNPYGVGN